jgi:hypothetical protein
MKKVITLLEHELRNCQANIRQMEMHGESSAGALEGLKVYESELIFALDLLPKD